MPGFEMHPAMSDLPPYDLIFASDELISNFILKIIIESNNVKSKS